MKVSRIQKLSEQHQSLKRFYDACNHNDVALVAKKTAHSYGDVELDYETTRVILSDVRVSLLKRISELENKIRKEAADGKNR